jgi:small subunit ribosomal protein S8
MTMTDPVADMLTRIRNANTAMHDSVKMPSSKLKESLAVILQREGYIAGFDVAASGTGPGSVLEIQLKYASDRTRTIPVSSACRGPGCASTPAPMVCPACSVAWVWPWCPPATGS